MEAKALKVKFYEYLKEGEKTVLRILIREARTKTGIPSDLDRI